jgi:hypothetical protein
MKLSAYSSSWKGPVDVSCINSPNIWMVRPENPQEGQHRKEDPHGRCLRFPIILEVRAFIQVGVVPIGKSVGSILLNSSRTLSRASSIVMDADLTNLNCSNKDRRWSGGLYTPPWIPRRSARNPHRLWFRFLV